LAGELIERGEPTLFDAVEELLIRIAFAWCHQNQVQTAKALGISRNIPRTHLKRFGLIGYDQSGLLTENGESANSLC
jgi:sigma-54-specific transcriptional regulator